MLQWVASLRISEIRTQFEIPDLSAFDTDVSPMQLGGLHLARMVHVPSHRRVNGQESGCTLELVSLFLVSFSFSFTLLHGRHQEP